MLLSYFTGIFTVIIPMIIFYLATDPSAMNDEQMFKNECWISTMPVFRFSFMCSYVVFGTGLAIHVFNNYKINYLYIFELDPRHKVTHIQLYRVSMVMLSFCMVCFLIQLMVCRLDYIFETKVAGGALTCFIIMLFIFMNPFHIFYRSARLEVLQTIFHVAITPFGKVRFKHFIFAAMLISILKPLQDIYFIGCFFINGFWLTSSIPKC